MSQWSLRGSAEQRIREEGCLQGDGRKLQVGSRPLRMENRAERGVWKGDPAAVTREIREDVKSYFPSSYASAEAVRLLNVPEYSDEVPRQ